MSEVIFTLAGMHRSGTSLVANWFHDSGIFMGNQLLDPASTNKKGHFEDMEILELHAKDLQNKGFHRSGLKINEIDWVLDKNNLIAAKKIINSREQNSIWGWKEPRSTLYLQQWRDLIPNLKVIGIYRDPRLVVKSLYKRLVKNKWYYTRNPITRIKWYFDIDRNPYKWHRIFSKTYCIYNKQLLNYFEMYPSETLIISLENLMKHPQTYKVEIEEFLGKELIPFENVFEGSLMSGKIESGQLKYLKEAMTLFNRLNNV